MFSRLILPRVLVALCVFCLYPLPAGAGEPQWMRLNSSHFSLVTNGEDAQGHLVIARFEQMRSAFGQLLLRTRINLPEPIEIVALRTEEDYSAVVPGRSGQLLSDGFFLPGEDRYYFVVNLSRSDSWRAVSYDFAKVLLNYNYPPTEPWFDEGFTQYFSSLRVGRTVQIGGEPESITARSNNFVSLLSSQPWIPATQLFATKPGGPGSPASPQDGMFVAESWMVMHYLINKNKLTQTGTYFDLAENQKLPVGQAIQQAFGMTAAQFDQEVKTYSQTVLPLVAQVDPAGKSVALHSIGQAPTLSPDEEIGASREDLSPAMGQALVQEMALRVPEHRDAAINKLNALASQPKLDNAIVHRALAFAFLQSKNSEESAREISKAAELDPKDPWLHFYAALLKYHLAQASAREFEGLANMMQDLHAVLDWNPEFAEAYNLLGLARVEGGGINSAMEAERAAMRLSPRNQQYQLNMAKIYIAAKKFEAAEAMLRQLATSSDATIAQGAQKQLADLPTVQKYGVAPQPAATLPPTPKPASSSPSQPHPEEQASNPNDEGAEQPPAQPQPDKRPVLYLKGRVLSVDCSKSPAAVVTLSAAGKTLRLHTADYNALTLIGADQFSCDWKNRAASANYKSSGQGDGDLISLELR